MTPNAEAIADGLINSTAELAPAPKENHAEQNARGWVESMLDMLTRFDEAIDDDRVSHVMARDSINERAAIAKIKKTGDLNEDDIREEIEQSVLSVQVRDGWRDPGAQSDGAEEFEILLTTGGPALRIRGELSDGAPQRAWLEWQDWGTPWTQYFKVSQDTLLRFAGFFYFGE